MVRDEEEVYKEAERRIQGLITPVEWNRKDILKGVFFCIKRKQ